MRTKWNRIALRLLALVVALLLVCPVYAHETPDLGRLCSFRVTMSSEDKPVAGGSLSLLQVGDVAWNDGNYFFVPSDAFALSSLDFTDINAQGLAEKLLSYAVSEQLEAAALTQEIDDKGVAAFTELVVGLYLVYQTQPAPGYSAIDPFLVSLPYVHEGQYLYDLDAAPKTELEQIPEETTKPTDPPGPPDIPQTGMLWWPVPLLLCGGLVLLTLGAFLGRRRKKQ